MRKIEKDSDGAIMLEALVVYMVTIFLLFFTLAMFSVFYHLWNMQTIANETAARIAQTYKFTEADVDTGLVSLSDLTNLERYRYLPGAQKAAKKENLEKLTTYMNRRLDKVSFVNKLSEPKIQLEIKKDALSSRHIEVTLSEEFEVPFGEALSYFGYDDTITYECTGYATCVDLIDYINTVDYADQQTSLGQFNSSTVKMINGFLKLFNHLVDKFTG